MMVWRRPLVLLLVAFLSGNLVAGPWIEPGDVRIRHDIHLLSDYGILDGPSLTWPRSWPEVAKAVNSADEAGLPAEVRASLARLRTDAALASRTDGIRLHASIAGAVKPMDLRTFADTPRENLEGSVSASTLGDQWAIKLKATLVNDPEDDKSVRLDGSYGALLLGNWIVTAGLTDQWWGSGQEGSLILSNNARPIPTISLSRNHADAFDNPWLSWIGPWRFDLTYGLLEDDRGDFSRPHFLTMRGSIRPFESFELALGRTSIWCGEDRPCGAGIFRDLLFGDESDLNSEQNPGNQLATIQMRWTAPRQWVPLGLYFDVTAEDSISPNGKPDLKDYLPKRQLFQYGAETWGSIGEGSFRAHIEYADTVCRYSVPDPAYNCAYEHFLYTDGYRFRGRVLGHSVEGDGRMISAGATYVDGFGDPWTLLLRKATINVAGESTGNRLSISRQQLVNLELSHSRKMNIGKVEVGVGYDHFTEGDADDRIRAFARLSFEL